MTQSPTSSQISFGSPTPSTSLPGVSSEAPFLPFPNQLTSLMPPDVQMETCSGDPPSSTEAPVRNSPPPDRRSAFTGHTFFKSAIECIHKYADALEEFVKKAEVPSERSLSDGEWLDWSLRLDGTIARVDQYVLVGRGLGLGLRGVTSLSPAARFISNIHDERREFWPEWNGTQPEVFTGAYVLLPGLNSMLTFSFLDPDRNESDRVLGAIDQL